MSKASNVPAKVGETPKSLAQSVGAVPDFMKSQAVEGVELLAKYQATPRLGIVQGSSLPERKAEHGEGGVAVFPEGLHIAGQGEEFVAIPICFWVTWEKWSDINDHSQPMVLETTQDETSEMARRAKDRVKRTEKYSVNGTDFKYKYVESLNFIMVIDSGPAKGEIVVMSFHIGEHRVGLTLSGNIKRRACSIYGNRFSFKTQIRTRNNRSWYGFELNNPSDEEGGFVRDPARYEALKVMHRDFDTLVKSSKIVITRDDDDAKAGEGEGTTDTGDQLPV